MKFHAMVLQDPPAPKPDGAPDPAPPAPGGQMGSTLLMFGLMFVIIYFMMIRPSRRQAKERENMLAAIKKNDHVLTSGGIYGIVDKVRERDVILKIDEKNDIRIRIARSAVVGVEKLAGAEEAGKKEPEQEKAAS